MSVDDIACATLAGYCLIFAGIALWRALHCPQGWRLWLLYVIDSLYCRLAFHWRANRRCPFLDERSAIIIANHRSPLDPLLIWVGMTNRRPPECLTAKEYFGIRGLQFIFEATRAIPVARQGKDMAATREALRRLKEGHYLGVFPEGRINTGPGLLPGDPGIAWLALHSQAPVYPVFIHNAPQADSMVSPFYTFTRVRISYGDRVDLSAYYGRRLTAELLQEVTDLLMSRLGALGGLGPALDVRPDDEPPATVLRMSNAG
ncbi:MAG: lysophospholipid acyltransferase family protein [Deltaproteobacteria bacterium]